MLNVVDWKSISASLNHVLIRSIYFIFRVWTGLASLSLSLLVRFNFLRETSLLNRYTYNTVITYHGITMLFFVIIPLLIGGLSNFLVPPLRGVIDIVYPRINNISFWILVGGYSLLLVRISVITGSVISGWTLYPPLRLQGSIEVDLCILSLHLAGVSSILGSINYIITILKSSKRAGVIPLFNVSIMVTSILLILAIPVLAGGLTMVILDHNFSTSFFDPVGGGDPVLYQHIFWFFGHPEVYIIILPAFGLINYSVPAAYNQKEVFGRDGISISMCTIGSLGFLVWSHHIYTTGMSDDFRFYFMGTTVIIAVPTRVKVFSWLFTIMQFKRHNNIIRIWINAFLITFVVGGLRGVILRSPVANEFLHDTYYVVAHFHFVLRLGARFGGVLALLYFWPLVTGLQLDFFILKLQIWLMSSFRLLLFLKLQNLGREGLVRRWVEFPLIFRNQSSTSTFTPFILAISTLLLFWAFFESGISRRKIVGTRSFKPWEQSSKFVVVATGFRPIHHRNRLVVGYYRFYRMAESSPFYLVVR